MPYSTSTECQHLGLYFDLVVQTTSEVTPNNDFWDKLIPQMAWCDSAIRHLISALAIGFRELIHAEYAGQTALSELIEQCCLAIREWSVLRNKQNSIVTGLMLSRILAKLGYTSGDFQSSIVHRLYGVRIAKEAIADSESDNHAKAHAQTTIRMDLCGPGFLAERDPVAKMVEDTRLLLFDHQYQVSIRRLRAIKHDFETWLFGVPKESWLALPGAVRCTILKTWATMNRALGSIFNPGDVPFETGNVTKRLLNAKVTRAVQETQKEGLLHDDEEMDAEALHWRFRRLMLEVDTFVLAGDIQTVNNLIQKTKEMGKLTDSFLVQAAEILYSGGKNEEEVEMVHLMD